MSKKSIRIISIIFTAAIVLMFLVTTAFAGNYSPDSVKNKIDTGAAGANKIEEVGGNILGIVRVAGTLIAVGVVMILGIKYMVGSAEEKASYKKTMIPYIVGAVLLFAASNLAQYVFNFAEGL